MRLFVSALFAALAASTASAQIQAPCSKPTLERAGLIGEFSGNFNAVGGVMGVQDGYTFKPGYVPPNGLDNIADPVNNPQWIDHTPWHGDFGNVGGNYPGTFSIVFDPLAKGRVLKITAQMDPAGNWHSGILSTVDSNGVGFHTRGGGNEVFEMRAKFPAGAGAWPAFWLNGFAPAPAPPGHELDVVEAYQAWVSNIHGVDHCSSCSPPSGNHIGTASGVRIDPIDDSAGYHSYAAEILPSGIEDFYVDGICVGELLPTNRADALKRMGVLVDLAIGGANGDTSGLPHPAFMHVQSIKVWHR